MEVKKILYLGTPKCRRRLLAELAVCKKSASSARSLLLFFPA